jgi:hypothetical protein
MYHDIRPFPGNDVLKLDTNLTGLKGSPTFVKRIFAPEKKVGEVIQGTNGSHQLAIEKIQAKLDEWKLGRSHEQN